MPGKAKEARRVAFQSLLDDPESREFLFRVHRQASLGQLLAGAAHQLRNPLNSIQQCAQLLNERPDDVELRAKLLPLVQRSAQRINDSLDAIDPPKGAVLESATLNLQRVVERCLLALRDRTMNIELEFLPGAVAWVAGSADGVQLLILSLLQTHLSGRPSHLQIELSVHGDRHELRVHSEGGASALLDEGFEFWIQSALASAQGASLTNSPSEACTTLSIPMVGA